MQEINNRPERRLQQSLWSKVAWAKPGAKEKRSAQQKIAQNRPETKAKKSASLKTAFNTPESKAKRSASAKIVQNRPEVRAKKEKGARQGGPRVGKIYKGVSFSKENKKWKAQIKARRKIKHLGYFDTEIEAAQAYNEGVDKYWGGEGYKNPV